MPPSAQSMEEDRVLAASRRAAALADNSIDELDRKKMGSGQMEMRVSRAERRQEKFVGNLHILQKHIHTHTHKKHEYSNSFENSKYTSHIHARLHMKLCKRTY